MVAPFWGTSKMGHHNGLGTITGYKYPELKGSNDEYFDLKF